MREKVSIVLFVGTLFMVSVLGIFFKDREYSRYERRKLVESDALRTNFFENIDGYLEDQFPFRDEIISLNSYFDRNILLNKGSGDVIISDGYSIMKNYPLDEKSLDSFIKDINYINEEYLKDARVFYSIIPDKSYFLGSGYPKIDFDYMLSKVKDNLSPQYIDIVDSLRLEDYFKNDIHLKQETYFKVLQKLDRKMNFDYRNIKYEKKVFKNFYGATYSKIPKTVSEELEYLTNSELIDADVWHLEYGNKPIYDKEKLDGIDSYNVFLSGPSSIVKIKNNNASSDKRLILFRDSFGSSMAPLLVPYYKEIVLVDLRYIKMSLVPNYVDFSNSDVLFLYSTLVVNDSNLLKVE